MERLQKVMARSGLGSRRACEELIRQGRVTVDGRPAKLGCKVDPRGQAIAVDGKPLSAAESKRYVALHKPRGVLSEMVDERGRETLSSLVPAVGRLFAVGRLDLNSEGLVLLTNDGELANRLTHPRYGHPKEYLVLVEGTPGPSALAQLRNGVVLDGRRTRPAAVLVERSAPTDLPNSSVADARDSCWLRVTLQEGRKRQIRHMCAAVGHPVQRLVRVAIASLRLGSMKAGEWRYLTAREVRQLKEGQGAQVKGSRRL